MFSHRVSLGSSGWTISQTFLILDDLDSFEEYSLGVFFLGCSLVYLVYFSFLFLIDVSLLIKLELHPHHVQPPFKDCGVMLTP